MRRIGCALIIVLACIPVTLFAQAPKDQGLIVLNEAIAIRAAIIEQKSGMSLGDGPLPRASLRRLMTSPGSLDYGMYDPDTGELYFSSSLSSHLYKRHRKPLRLMTAVELAEDIPFQAIVDHELGHALMDRVSRRHGDGPWYTDDYFWATPYEQRLGLTTIAEGVATWFAHLDHPDEREYYSTLFPAAPSQLRFWNVDDITYRGGYWLVRDVMNRYGEQGMLWLMRHPLTLSTERGSMRISAEQYRKRALAELAMQ